MHIIVTIHGIHKYAYFTGLIFTVHQSTVKITKIGPLKYFPQYRKKPIQHRQDIDNDTCRKVESVYFRDTPRIAEISPILLKDVSSFHAAICTLSILFHSLLTSISCSCSSVFSKSIFSLRSCMHMHMYPCTIKGYWHKDV